MTLLTGGSRNSSGAYKEQLEHLQQEVRELAAKEISDDELEAHFEKMPPRYFEIRAAREIHDDLELVHRFLHQLILEDDRTLASVTAWLDEPDRGYNLVKICTWDQAGLFNKIRRKLPERQRPKHSGRADFHPHRRHRPRHGFRE